MSMPAEKRMSVAEFLAFEEQSDGKHEYYDGEIFAMAGGTAIHSLIAANCIRELGKLLTGRDCFAYTSDLMIATASDLLTYPDVSVVCGEPSFAEESGERVLLNPIAIVEVLSPTTEAYDRGKKFEHYQSIDSLKEYVLVAQDRVHVDRFTRQPDGGWLLTAVGSKGASIELPTLGGSIPLEEIYVGVAFEKQAKP